jgi:disulfide bond formation protein DsbB
MAIKIERMINAIALYLIAAILVAAYIYQYMTMEHPCELCLLQRFAYFCIGVGFMLNLRFTMKPAHYGFSFLSSLFGASVALTQWIFYLKGRLGWRVIKGELFIKNFFIFLAAGILIALVHYGFRSHCKDENRSFPLSEKIAIGLLFILAVANFFTAFQ